MLKRGLFNVPVVGVAKSGWSREQLRERARASLTEHGGGIDKKAYCRLMDLLW
jgi:glucose-6-phosphate 1-dehydrogenase